METTQPLAAVLKVRVSEQTKAELESQARSLNRKPAELARLLILEGLEVPLTIRKADSRV